MGPGFTVLSAILFASCVGYANAQGMDIVFILDGSGSVGQANYDGVFLPFIRAVAESLPDDSDLYRIGLVSFGNEGEIQMEFVEARDGDLLRERLDGDSVRFLNQNTNTSGGIYVARRHLFPNKDMGARENAAKLAILMTDGPSTYHRERTPIEARAAREQGITMFVMGINNPGQTPLDLEEIDTIASEPVDDHQVIVSSFDELRTNMQTYADDMAVFIQVLAGEGEANTTLAPPQSTTRLITTTQTTVEDTRRPTEEDRTTMRPATTTQAPQESEWSCRFESDGGFPTMCGMNAGRDGDFTWLLRAGRTPSQNTGPGGAYWGSVYAYMEASRPRKPDDEAVLFVPKRVNDGRQCLSFAAHMRGDDVGSLQVVQVRADGNQDVLFTADGQQASGQWFERSVEAVVNPDDRGLAFRGVVGDGYRGDIALDFINVRSGFC